jgi:hypothetical protein
MDRYEILGNAKGFSERSILHGTDRQPLPGFLLSYWTTPIQ